MSAFDLGRPIGQQTSNPREGTEAGEHGSGVGLSGGHGTANASNTQSGQFAQQERSGFNSGLGGEHASGGLPGHSNSGSNHPIADKFTSSSSGFTGSSSGGGLTSSSGRSAGDKLDNSLDQYSGNQDHSSHSHGHSGVGAGLGAGAAAGLAGGAAAGHHHHDNNQHQHGLTGGNAPRGDAVSGAYAGGGVSDALTGESHAQRTGAGVGPLGENAIAGSTGGSAALGSGQTGTGVGPSGGAGGHYDSSAPHGHHGAGAAGGALAGAGAAGVGAGALSRDSNDRSNTTGNTNTNTDSSANKGTGQGHFGTVKEDDFNRGAPVSDPKDLDSGGRHGLVFQESTGKYVHRHELEEKR